MSTARMVNNVNARLLMQNMLTCHGAKRAHISSVNDFRSYSIYTVDMICTRRSMLKKGNIWLELFKISLSKMSFAHHSESQVWIIWTKAVTWMKNGNWIMAFCTEPLLLLLCFVSWLWLPIFCVKPKINTFDTETQNTTTNFSVHLAKYWLTKTNLNATGIPLNVIVAIRQLQ